jgi:hypothetical protein
MQKTVIGQVEFSLAACGARWQMGHEKMNKYILTLI